MLPSTTKILTTTGFKAISDVKDGDSIYSLDTYSDTLVESPVLSNHSAITDLWMFENSRITLYCNPSLKLKGWRRSKTRGKPSINVETIFEIGKATQEHNAVIAFPVTDGGRSLCCNKAELLGYIASDGYWSWSKLSDATSSSKGTKKQVNCSLSQAEHKFVNEIKFLLDSVGAKYSVHEKKSENKYKVYGFSLSSPWAREYLQDIFPERKDKHDVNWAEFVLSLDNNSFESFYRGFYNGDGTLGTNQISQNPGNIQDGVVAAMIRKGLGVVSKNRRHDGTVCETVRFHTKRHITMQEFDKNFVQQETCFSPITRLGSCVIMQQDFIGVVFLK